MDRTGSGLSNLGFGTNSAETLDSTMAALLLVHNHTHHVSKECHIM
jgi:hypothetical protein